MLLFKSQVRQDFKKTLQNANSVYNETLTALQPVIDAYWHYYYLIVMSTYHSLEVTMDDLKIAFSDLPSYVKQLKNLQVVVNNQYQSNSKALLKFKPNVEKFNDWSEDLSNRLDSLISGLEQLKSFKDYKELRYIYSEALNLRKQILSVNSARMSTNTDCSI